MTAATATLPSVSSCAASACSYNRDAACHAGAVTIGGDEATCGTFVEISFRTSAVRTGVVGACHRTECSFNSELACSAPSIEVAMSGDKADCTTFAAR